MTKTQLSKDLNYSYEEAPISKIKELLDAGYDVEVDSPDGYVPVTRYVEKGLKHMFKINCNEHEVLASYDHMFQTDAGWVHAANLDEHAHKILCDDKKFHSFKKEYLEEGMEVVDVEVDHQEHRYYTNGLSSHNTNIGKTLIMCSLATNMIMNGNSVLYLTFEDPENKIAARIAQNMFDLTQQEFKSMSRDNFYKAYTNITNKIKSRLMIKEMPEYAVNSLQVNAYLKELKEKKQFVPDVVFIDYIGCMIPNGKPNPNMNTNTTLQLVAAQVRALAQIHGFPIISGLQANRGGNNIAEISLTDVADSFASTMKADAIFGVTQPDEFQQQNVYCMKLLKTRYGGKNRGATFLVGVDTEKQRIYDVAQDKVANDTVNIFDSQPISKNDGSVELDEIDYL